MSAKTASRTRRPKTPAERRKGWIVIALVAIGTAAFFIAGTIDPQTRYEWIKL